MLCKMNSSQLMIGYFKASQFKVSVSLFWMSGCALIVVMLELIEIIFNN